MIKILIDIIFFMAPAGIITPISLLSLYVSEQDLEIIISNDEEKRGN